MRIEQIKNLLPYVYQEACCDGSPLKALLGAMEALHDKTENQLEVLDETFDSRRTGRDFVCYLASWVDMLEVFSMQGDFEQDRDRGYLELLSGIGRLRELIMQSAEIARWRGTSKGLMKFLETATGITGYKIEECVSGKDDRETAFHIRIIVPGEAKSMYSLVQRIIELEKPAYVTYELEFEKRKT